MTGCGKTALQPGLKAILPVSAAKCRSCHSAKQKSADGELTPRQGIPRETFPALRHASASFGFLKISTRSLEMPRLLEPFPQLRPRTAVVGECPRHRRRRQRRRGDCIRRTVANREAGAIGCQAIGEPSTPAFT